MMEKNFTETTRKTKKWCEYSNNSLKGFVANDYDGDIVKAVTITQNMNLCFSSNDQEFWNCC